MNTTARFEFELAAAKRRACMRSGQSDYPYLRDRRNELIEIASNLRPLSNWEKMLIGRITHDEYCRLPIDEQNDEKP